MKIIKDTQNKLIGTVKTQGTVTRLTDKYNRTIATYNSKTDTTVSNGKAVGRGNQLIRCIK